MKEIDRLWLKARMYRRFERYAKESGNTDAEVYDREQAELYEAAVKALKRLES